MGVLLKFTGVEKREFQLDSHMFFLYLLPPVVFEVLQITKVQLLTRTGVSDLQAGYFIPRRAFFDHVGSILCFAVLGTLFNTVCIGSVCPVTLLSHLLLATDLRSP